MEIYVKISIISIFYVFWGVLNYIYIIHLSYPYAMLQLQTQ